jgi:hypothetical protein
MRLEKLNRIVGEAIINQEFCRRLLTDPRTAAIGFDLATDELELLSSLRADSVDQLARSLVSALALDDRSYRSVGSRTPGVGSARNLGHHQAPGKSAAPPIRAYMSPEP